MCLYDLSIATRRMHQTTIRFPADLWGTLEAECGRLGVSVAQYLREAALTRLVYSAGRRGDREYELALERVAGKPDAVPAPAVRWPDMAPSGDQAGDALRGRERVRERARSETAASRAVWAQAQQARQHAQQLRESRDARGSPRA